MLLGTYIEFTFCYVCRVHFDRILTDAQLRMCEQGEGHVVDLTTDELWDSTQLLLAELKHRRNGLTT